MRSSYYRHFDGKPNRYRRDYDKAIKINVNCEGKGNGDQDETAAFRAVNDQDQRVEVFQNEQFDIGNIYNAAASTFVPLKEGVYSVAGTVTFLPDSTTTEYHVRVEIHVKGVSVAADNDYWGDIKVTGVRFVNAINVSTILLIQPGDLVEVCVTSTTPGVILTDTPSFSTRFEAKM
ncbi:MAG: hypothetical protein ACQEV7_21300 [Bacillota bacterium]